MTYYLPTSTCTSHTRSPLPPPFLAFPPPHTCCLLCMLIFMTVFFMLTTERMTPPLAWGVGDNGQQQRPGSCDALMTDQKER